MSIDVQVRENQKQFHLKTRNNTVESPNEASNSYCFSSPCRSRADCGRTKALWVRTQQVKKLKGYFLTAPVRSIDAATLQAQSDAGAGLEGMDLQSNFHPSRLQRTGLPA